MKQEKFFAAIAWALAISVPLWWLGGAMFFEFRKMSHVLMGLCMIGAILCFVLYLIFDTINNWGDK